MKNSKETFIIEANADIQAFDLSGPEKGLLKAILTSAMNEVIKDGMKARDAIRYFLNVNDEYIFSFHSVCDFLSVSPRQILIATGLIDEPDFMFRYKQLLKQKKEQEDLLW